MYYVINITGFTSLTVVLIVHLELFLMHCRHTFKYVPQNLTNGELFSNLPLACQLFSSINAVLIKVLFVRILNNNHYYASFIEY